MWTNDLESWNIVTHYIVYRGNYHEVWRRYHQLPTYDAFVAKKLRGLVTLAFDADVNGHNK